MKTVDTLFDTQPYQYPVLNDNIKEKLGQLEASICKLEANLITPQTHRYDNGQAGDPRLPEHLKVDYGNELNPSQLLAATMTQGKVLVIAGAGSGKTKTLTYRTSYLIENGVQAASILLLTFTRKAANEIKSRAGALLFAAAPDQALLNGIQTGTFHSFCHRLLRQYSGLLGIHPKFTVLDTGDSEDAIDLILKEKNYPIDKKQQAFPSKKTLQTLFSSSRNRRIMIRDLILKDYPDSQIHLPIIEQLAKDYHQYKRLNHLYDFDDIISQVVSHLKSNEKFKKIMQETYRYVMVDEYQDTNIPQKQLIDLICEPEAVSLMVVGDDNQSIYAFRGANYENILLFSKTYPNAKMIKLQQNYRSTPAILDFINALSQHISLGYQKNLFSDAAIAGNKPFLVRRSKDSDEAVFIADTIKSLKSEHDYKDFAVLGRTSYQSNFVQLEFMKQGIPFIVVGGLKFIERRHIKDVLALVKVLYNPNDSIAWHRILTLFKGVGTVTSTKLTNLMKSSTPQFDALLDAKFSAKTPALLVLHQALTDAERLASVVDIVEHLIHFYHPHLKTIEENWRERSEDFKVLTNLAKEHDSLDSFLENLALDPPNDSAAIQAQVKIIAEDDDNDVVTISTIHSAKGLEWPVVFVNALVDGQMPHHRTIGEFEDLEEERKLFYVACSRAKTHLYLTAPDFFSSYSGYFDKVSRFVAEVPSHSVDVVTRAAARQPPKTDEPEWW